MKGNNKIKISIVVPVYNVEPFIKQCVDSLINQTLKEIEIILIDDCSPDNCGSICDEYAVKDNRVVVIHNEVNLKQGQSSNLGINAAKGEYLGFVDPDDWIDLDFFEKLYFAAKKDNSDIAKTERIKVFPDGRKEKQNTVNRKIKKGIKRNLPVFLLYRYEHTTAIFRRDIIIKHQVTYPNIRNALDNIFLLKATYYSSSISIVSGTYYYYRQHGNSAVYIRELPYFQSMLQYYALYIDFLNNHEMEKSHYNFLFSYSFNLVKSRYKEMDEKPELQNYRGEYVDEILKVLGRYKYDKGFLLNEFFNEFSIKRKVKQLVNSKLLGL